MLESEIPGTDEIVREIEGKAEELGVSVSRILRLADIAGSTYQNWKAGKFSPSLENLRKLRSAFVDLEEEASSA